MGEAQREAVYRAWWHEQPVAERLIDGPFSVRLYRRLLRCRRLRDESTTLGDLVQLTAEDYRDKSTRRGRNRIWRRGYLLRQRERAARWLCSDTWGRDALWTVIIRHGVDRKPCSCDMCGNPRRHHGKLSVGEQRQQAAWREAVDGPY